VSTRVHATFGKQSARPESVPRDATRVAAIQMASGPKVDGNLREAENLIAIAAEQGAKLVALPENFAIMGLTDTDKIAVRERPGQGPIQAFLSAAAKRHRIWLVGGSIPFESSVTEKVRNTCLVYDDNGIVVARYDKIHLFGFEMGSESYREERTIEAGKEIVTVESPFGRLGISICYDLRFPELYRAMKDVDIMFVPSAFTETTGKAHWEVLVRARAIENLCYVVAPAQGGYHVSGRETHGDSMIVDPWGVILDRLPRGSGVVMAAVNRAHLARLRQSLPARSHRTLHTC
jgi:deaminated glutathione amidase